MPSRAFWQQSIESAWQRRSVVWLPGVRRVGKTTLCRSLANIEYFDCELPRQRRMLEDPEAFLESVAGKRIVLDEIHRLRNPAEILKIAADHYPRVRILATGSSTLDARRKFRDSLAGRKAEVWLTPAMSADAGDLQVPDIATRLLRGGLPPFLLADHDVESEFQEWLDAYWAKDIQELFRLARPCEVSRPTITNYLRVLEGTFIAHVVRPYSSGKTHEIVAAPKVYGFDTGFVCYFRGWAALRRGGPPIGIECKWSTAALDVERAMTRRFGDLSVKLVSLEGLISLLKAAAL